MLLLGSTSCGNRPVRRANPMRSRRVGSLFLLLSLRSGGRLRRRAAKSSLLLGLSSGSSHAATLRAPREHVRVQPEEPTRCDRDALALCFSCPRFARATAFGGYL